ncbi:hypothetical protein DFH06DRAFT_1169759 [Mycena polygramma]|nr:hypothetical protein DFH06DRAFT_1169759 [Mycena polygramma]
MSPSLMAAVSHLRRLSGKPALELLPSELWDLVLNSLTNDGLLQTACVCRALNEISLSLYVRRHDMNMASTSLRVLSYFLRVMHIACITPRIDTLRCKFRTFDVLRDMRSLRGVLRKCPQLTDISLDWGFNNLFRIHSFDTKVSYPPEALITTLLDVLCTIADRTPGPVVVVASGSIFRFQSKDISHWELLSSKAPPGHGRRRLLARLQSVLRRSRPRGCVSLAFHDHSGEYLHLDCINSVVVRSIHGGPELGWFTLITLQTAHLALQPTLSLPPTYLSTLLAHIVLPALVHLELKSTAIDPVALAAFLNRHPAIRKIGITHSGDPEGWAPGRALCSPSAILPNLVQLDANDGFALTSLLDAFDFPRVRMIHFCAPRSTALHLAGWKSALRRLSLRTHPTELELIPSRMVSGDRTVPVDDEERLIVGTLFCVNSVRLTDAEIGDAYHVLKWMAMLPALQTLVLRLPGSRNSSYSSEITGFLEHARGMLPGRLVTYLPTW